MLSVGVLPTSETTATYTFTASTFESFRLGAGHPTVVSTWGRSWPVPTRKNGSRLLNPSGKKVWREDGPTEGKCLWEMHNVWGWDVKKNDGVVLRESYFKNHPATGKKVTSTLEFLPYYAI